MYDIHPRLTPFLGARIMYYARTGDDLIGKYKTVREAKRWGTFYTIPGTPIEIRDEYGTLVIEKRIYTKQNGEMIESWEEPKER